MTPPARRWSRSARRRKWVYELRARWARSHLGGAKVAFGLGFEVEGLELTKKAPALVMMRDINYLVAIDTRYIGEAAAIDVFGDRMPPSM